jgi:hypothetical protein
MRLFQHPSPSSPHISHTSRSAALAKAPGLAALVQTVLDETSPPMMLLPEALRRFSAGKKELSTKQEETAFRLCHSGGVWGEYGNTWEFIENDGEGERKGWRARNFVKFMSYIKELFNTEEIVLNAIDWEAAGDATVVDVSPPLPLNKQTPKLTPHKLGGSAGHDTIPLATRFPNLTITIQDLAQVSPVFHSTFPSSLRSRVNFQTHNLFDPQPVSADIYILKWILHDWPDKESVEILKALVPAMKKGSRVLFIDYVGTEDGPTSSSSETSAPTTTGQEKRGQEEEELPRSLRAFGTATDMRMMALFNARERPVSAWREIFRRADERYEVVRVERGEGAFMCVLEAVWRG